MSAAPAPIVRSPEEILGPLGDPASLFDALPGPAAGRHDTRSSSTGHGEQDTFRPRKLKAG